jgi:hypothetical protein
MHVSYPPILGLRLGREARTFNQMGILYFVESLTLQYIRQPFIYEDYLELTPRIRGPYSKSTKKYSVLNDSWVLNLPAIEKVAASLLSYITIGIPVPPLQYPNIRKFPIMIKLITSGHGLQQPQAYPQLRSLHPHYEPLQM